MAEQRCRAVGGLDAVPEAGEEKQVDSATIALTARRTSLSHTTDSKFDEGS